MSQEQELILNLADWIERRKDHLSPSYADHIIHSVRHYEAEITALHAQLEKAREVKPLVWAEECDFHSRETWEAQCHGCVGRYIAYDPHDLRTGCYLELEDGELGVSEGPYETIEAAKAAAQADYQRRYNAMSQEGE